MKSLVISAVLIYIAAGMGSRIPEANNVCFKVSSRHFDFKLDNVVVDMSYTIKNGFETQVSQHETEAALSQMQQLASKFQNVYIDLDFQPLFPESQHLVNQLHPFVSVSLHSESDVAKKLVDRKRAVKALLVNASSGMDSVQAIYLELKTLKDQVSSLGLITPPVDISNVSLLVLGKPEKQNPAHVSQIYSLVDQVFVHPLDCSGDDHTVDSCFIHLTRIVDKFKSTLMQGANGKVPRVGMITTTSHFGTDYDSRAKLWCRLNEHGGRTNRTIIMTDDDTLIRHYEEVPLHEKIPHPEFQTDEIQLQNLPENSKDTPQPKPEETQTQFTPWHITILTVMSVVAFILFIVIIIQCNRTQKLRRQLRR